VDNFLSIGLTTAVFFGLPTLIFAALTRRNRNAWGAGPPVVLPPGSSDYRSAELVGPGRPRGAPAVVKIAAWTSLLLGQMFVPGLAWALVGLLYMGLGLVSIPGLVVAARCFWSAVLLLRRDPRAAEYAAKTARYATILNAIIVVGCAGTFLFAVLQGGSDGTVGLVVGTLVYALLSLGHAWLLNRAGEAVADERQRSSPEPLIDAIAA
jgi:hypothetical protein